MGGALDPTVASARNTVKAALADLAPGSRVVVGVSGGADSLALAAVTAFVTRGTGLDVTAIVVDHGLQAGSAAVAERVVTQLEGMGLRARVEAVTVSGPGGPEASARAARLSALTREPVDAVLLAHTLDDQAETVLLGLGRGSGPRSIAGMAARSGVFRRPFLGISRSDTEQICQSHGLTWWVDPHNSDPAFRRVRLRAEALPLLEDVLDGGVAAALGRTAAQLRVDLDYLDDVADGAYSLEVDDLEAMVPAIRTRVLRRAALAAGARADELAATHIGALDRLITDWHGQQRVELPGGVSCSRDRDCLRFGPTPVAG